MTRFLNALIFLCLSQTAFAIDIQPNTLYPRVQLDTNMGKIVVELDRKRAPLTVDNFLTYVVNGHYDNTLFHRVIASFVVQGGGLNLKQQKKPVNPPITNESGSGLSNLFGTIALARGQTPHSATSQFYFNLGKNKPLDPSSRRWGYAVFGEIVAGEEVLIAISNVATEHNTKLNWPNFPIKDVILEKATLLPKK